MDLPLDVSYLVAGYLDDMRQVEFFDYLREEKCNVDFWTFKKRINEKFQENRSKQEKKVKINSYFACFDEYDYILQRLQNSHENYSSELSNNINSLFIIAPEETD